MSSPVRSAESLERHVYEPHKAGLPPLGQYVRELWRRRGFAIELARTQMHAANTDTFFGQLWLVLNPLLLAGVYYLLVDVIGGGSNDPATAKAFFATLTSGLFLFYFITGSMQAGATSITRGGRLIMNTPFPRMLLTISTVYQSFRRYLPTFAVYLVIHAVTGQPWGWQMLWMFPLWGIAIMMGLGLANIFATLQVYFRDTTSFMPYMIRIWLYLSPVLWTVDSLRERAGQSRGYQLILDYSVLNPVYGLLGSQSQVLVEGRSPEANLMLHGLAWAVGLLVLGSVLLMSREREFAVRL